MRNLLSLTLVNPSLQAQQTSRRMSEDLLNRAAVHRRVVQSNRRSTSLYFQDILQMSMLCHGFLNFIFQ
jgi:hypothetical protein